jgi:hypothetical protein
MSIVDWPSKALCRLDKAKQWTSDEPPGPTAMIAMREICERCPVMTQCAQRVLTDDLPYTCAGVYAGVWVPGSHSRHYRKRRSEAIKILQARAYGIRLR